MSNNNKKNCKSKICLENFTSTWIKRKKKILIFVKVSCIQGCNVFMYVLSCIQGCKGCHVFICKGTHVNAILTIKEEDKIY